MYNIEDIDYINEETSIRFYGEWTDPLAEKMQTAWLDAMALDHNIPDWLRYMYGMSGKKYRYFINNFISSLDDVRYLEVGSWSGSTACSAMINNKGKFTCIDNWSDFGGPRTEFLANIDKAKNNNIEFKLIDSDFRNVDYNNIGHYNIYLFDGPHSEQDQYDGVCMAQDALDNKYILIIDDYNQIEEQKGTNDALEALQQKIICSIEIITMQPSVYQQGWKHPWIAHHRSDWHNGYLIALIEK